MSVEQVLESSTDTMTDEQVHEFLTEQGTGVLALSDESVPYAVPLSFGYDGESAL